MIRLALTKGRIEKTALEYLAKAGYDVSELDEDKKGRKLLFKVGDDIEVVLAKAADVITYVEHGVCDGGIVGEDTIMEAKASVYELLDLEFGKCRFALAGIKGKDFYDGYNHKIIASKYPNVTKDYFNAKGIDVEVVKIDGSVELAPILGLSDAIVDIVETGSTLKANGLEVYEDVAPISARFIANISGIKMKKKEFDKLLSALSEVVKSKREE
ncbi:MAG: ATP phosphoribosyltransferase [Ruminococcaceae bacterium]|nr:ATP phosphoribosyltransferase [Oscillospiraceae bacterium]